MGTASLAARDCGIGVLCGIVAACLYLAVLLGSPGALIFVYLTQLPLFIAGLWLGAGTAAIAGATASLVLLAASDWMSAVVFAALNAVPVTLLVRQALRARPGAPGGPDGGTPAVGGVEWYPPGLLAAWLTGLGLVGLTAAILVLGGTHGIEATLRPILDRLISQLGAPPPGATGHAAAGSDATRSALIGMLAMVTPGIVAAAWMVMAVVNGLLAQGLLARFGANWRPSPDIAALDLPRWVALALVVAAAAAALAAPGAGAGGVARFVGINMVILLVVPLGLAGLAVLHVAARRLAHPMAALAVFYVMAALFGWPLLLMAVLGLAEAGFGLRRRLVKP